MVVGEGYGASIRIRERNEEVFRWAPRQRPQALLTMLYRSTDDLCRRGAPV